MNISKKTITTLILSISLILFGGSFTSNAYTGYSGADGALSYAPQQANIAKIYLDDMGYNTSLYSGSAYTESSVSNNVASVRAFYVSCHGSSNASAFWTNNSASSVTSSELYSWTSGFYKFGFIDACHSGETQAMYNALNMSDGDGGSHAFLGWIGYSYDSYNYYNFTTYVFQGLAAGKTINDAVWSARVWTGITNYQIYGDYGMTM